MCEAWSKMLLLLVLLWRTVQDVRSVILIEWMNHLEAVKMPLPVFNGVWGLHVFKHLTNQCLQRNVASILSTWACVWIIISQSLLIKKKKRTFMGLLYLTPCWTLIRFTFMVIITTVFFNKHFLLGYFMSSTHQRRCCFSVQLAVLREAWQ